MSRPWFDPRVPDVDRCVLRPLLDRHAATAPDKVFARFADGTEWTYAQTRAIARQAAIGLAALGVTQGDHVLSWLPNGPDALRVWFGLNYLGAVYVPINLAYRGGVLAHVVANADARLIVAHADLVGRLAEIDRVQLTAAVLLNGTAPAIPGLTMHPRAALEPEGGDLPPLARDIAPWDMQTIIYTSGTTGPSKGVMSSYLQLYTMGTESFTTLGADDRFMVNLPLFHVGGTAAVYAMLALGGSIAIVEAFDTASFWRVVSETGTTSCVLLGVMATFLVKQAPGPQDRGHPLKSAIMVPLCEDAAAFSGALRLRHLHRVQHDRGVDADPLGQKSRTARHLRHAAAGRRGAGGRRERLRGRPRRGRRAARAHRPAVGDEPRLLQEPGGHRQGVAQRLVPHRRRLPGRRRRPVLLRRPHEGRNPPPRREHLLIRGRDRAVRPSCRQGGGRRCRAE
jgi:hypothetical protein